MSNIFEKIVKGEIKAWTIWEDDSYMAFLTPFPNTPGFTVVIPKANHGDYIFNLAQDEYVGLMDAAKKVAKLLEKGLNVKRVALIFEGTGVDWVHAKLIPLHGELGSQTNVWSKVTEFNEEYTGHLTTSEGPKMSDERLDEIQRKIRGAA